MFQLTIIAVIINILSHRKGKISKHWKKGQITVVACGNAAGQGLLPLIIFDAKNIQQTWIKNEVPGLILTFWFYDLF